jgi:hypothetical protein
MTAGPAGQSGASGVTTKQSADREPKLPPVAEMGIAALVFTVGSGIYLAAEAQRHASLVPAIVGLILSGALVIAAAALLARTREFAWGKFRMVFGWALLEYAVIAGMLVFVFVRDHLAGSTLTLFVVALVIFAADIPMMFAFSVARFQPAGKRGRERAEPAARAQP